MECPSKFIADSNFASTPSSLLTPKILTFSTPTPLTLTAGYPQTFDTTASFQDYFDSFQAYLSIDGSQEIGLNGTISLEEYDANGHKYWVYAHAIMLNNRTVALRVLYYTAYSPSVEVTISHAFKAIVAPILSPFQPD